MYCNYYLINPTNNVTVLVESQFPTEVQPFVAKKLLEIEKSAEQVGFIIDEKNNDFDIKIRMSGGEFCGNACMAAAALVKARKKNLNTFNISMSGHNEIVEVEALSEYDNDFYSVKMPQYEKTDKIMLNYEGRNFNCPIVKFDGISHIIINEKMDKAYSESLIRRTADMIDCDAVGFMFVNDSFCKLKPLVYVKKADTMYWENSCASGTTAIGWYLFNEKFDSFPLTVNQPGGDLSIYADYENKILRLRGFCKIEKYEEAVLI